METESTNNLVSQKNDEADRINALLQKRRLLETPAKFGNKPCPCGSGIKAKKCCKTAQKWNEVEQERKALLEERLAKKAEERKRKEEEKQAAIAAGKRPPHRLNSALGLIALASALSAFGSGRRL